MLLWGQEDEPCVLLISRTHDTHVPLCNLRACAHRSDDPYTHRDGLQYSYNSIEPSVKDLGYFGL